MIRCALSLLLLVSSGNAQRAQTILQPIARPRSGVVNGLTFTLVQHPNNVSCTTIACAVTTSATTAGNLLIVWSAVKYVGTGFAAIEALTGVTDNGTSETWTHCPSSAVNNAASSDGTLYAIDCYYILSAAGGATSVTATWTLSGLTSATQKVDVQVIEVHPSAPVFYDTGNAFFNNTSCTSCQAPAGLLSGTSDFVSQATVFPGALVTAISAPYSNPFDADNTNQVFGAFAGALNQASYSRPSWSEGVAHNPNYMATVAFGGNASPAPTGMILVDFSACTNGSALTTTCVGNSTFSGWELSQDSSNMGTGVTASTAGPSSNLPATTTINGVAKSGNSTLNFHGVTNASGNGIVTYNVGLGFNEPASYAPLTVGYTFQSSCLATSECGALLRMSTGNGNYAMAHASPLGNGKFCLESVNGGTCQDTGATYAPNTAYRINTQIAAITGTVDRLTICNDATGAVLGTATATSAASNNGVTVIEIGVTGEEPATAGIDYYFRNVVVGGAYSTTKCF